MKIKKIENVDCLTSNKGHIIITNITPNQICDFREYADINMRKLGADPKQLDKKKK